MDRQLEVFHEDIASEYRYINPKSFSNAKYPYRVWAVHCLYHLNLCALHSSVVPIFSSTPADSKLSKKLIRLCAEQAIKSSLIIADLANVFVSMQMDVTQVGKRRTSSGNAMLTSLQLNSIFGYAIFVASCIHFKSLGAQRKLRSHGIGRLYGAITILKTLKEMWYPLKPLVSYTNLVN